MGNPLATEDDEEKRLAAAKRHPLEDDAGQAQQHEDRQNGAPGQA
jgi:hypothetical protein